MNQDMLANLIAERAELRQQLDALDGIIKMVQGGIVEARYTKAIEAEKERRIAEVRATPAQHEERVLKLRAARFDMVVARINYLWSLKDLQEPDDWTHTDSQLLQLERGTCSNGCER